MTELAGWRAGLPLLLQSLSVPLDVADQLGGVSVQPLLGRLPARVELCSYVGDGEAGWDHHGPHLRQEGPQRHAAPDATKGTCARQSHQISEDLSFN